MGGMRLRIDCSYDGTAFHGWARQPGQRTVQGELEATIAKVLHLWKPDDDGHPITLVVAGRTDAGVHASGQVCHLDLEDEVLSVAMGHLDPTTYRPWEALAYRLRRILPADISVRSIFPSPAGFDARFSASDRVYVYRVADESSAYDPRLRGFVLNLPRRLDLDLMNQAAQSLVGLHDFGSFSSPNPGGTTIREVKFARWERVPTHPLGSSSYAGGASLSPTQAIGADPSAAGSISGFESCSGSNPDSPYRVDSVESGLLIFTIIADAFAKNMVRSLVNACLQVGMGKKGLDWFAGKLAHPVREGASGPAPACGLTLEKVNYPADDLLAARAQAIRAKRTLD